MFPQLKGLSILLHGCYDYACFVCECLTKGEQGGIKSNPESSTEINLIYGKVARDFVLHQFII